jgi:acetylornithine/succinyldiaminopimelate/putrescine aminotransferase
MNSGAEAVESAIKVVRKWGYEVKGVLTDKPRSSSARRSSRLPGRSVSVPVLSRGSSWKPADLLR